MKYEIKSYKEEFLEDQVKIGNEETKKWRFSGQTSVEQLKVVYSQPNFDPETRLYAFQDEKMVGFVTSSIVEEEGKKIGDARIPFVLEGHEEARSALLERAIEVLKSKGAKTLRTPVSKYWGHTIQFAEKFGFKFQSDITLRCRKELGEFDKTKLVDPVDVQLFDYNKHASSVVKLVMKIFNATEEQAQAVVDRYQDWKIGEEKSPFGFPQKLILHLLVIENNEVIGRWLGFTDQREEGEEKTVNIFAGYIKDNDSMVGSQLLAAAIRESKKVKMDALLINIGTPEEKKIYTPYGLEFDIVTSWYTKELTP